MDFSRGINHSKPKAQGGNEFLRGDDEFGFGDINAFVLKNRSEPSWIST
jgi:hypothetical protein